MPSKYHVWVSMWLERMIGDYCYFSVGGGELDVPIFYTSRMVNLQMSHCVCLLLKIKSTDFSPG